MPDPPRVSVIVPARDARATLPALLDALAALEPVEGGHEVLLVDDGSTDGTRELAEATPGVRVLRSPGRGPGAARQHGADRARGDVLAFTDADCAPRPGWLRGALRHVDHGGADVVQGRVVPARDPGPFDRTVSVGHLTLLFETANLVVRRARFEAVGGFEPWLTPRGGGKELGEDVWLGWRLVRAGARVAWAPDAEVVHAVFPGSPLTCVAERARLRFFPHIVRRIPELRGPFCFARVFLWRRSALADLALAGALGALIARRPLLALLALPHLCGAWRAARPHGRRAPLVLLAYVAADVVGAGALAWGSVRARTFLL